VADNVDALFMSMQLHTNIEQASIFKDMFDCLPLATALADERGSILYANNAFHQFTGMGQSDAHGENIESFFYPPASDNRGLLARFENCMLDRLEICDVQFRSHRGIGPINVTINRLSSHLCFILAHPVRPAIIPTATPASYEANRTNAVSPGDLPATLPPPGSIDKATEEIRERNKVLVEKIEELARHNRELWRSNQDLSQYAYVASHDLQEPLRKIRIFSDILINNEQLSRKDKFIANKINFASERMSLLIRDLLNYSKLLKSDAVFEPVNLGEIMKAVMMDFEVTIQEKQAVINFPVLPVVTAVKLQMNQLFYNLLGNALKFTQPEQPPVVDITVEELSGNQLKEYIDKPIPQVPYLRITFTDHGIGFAERDSEQIFEVFRRLYPREVYEGSGIGLALCRRIVQNHGGYLYAISQPGKGASFNIVIPQERPAPQQNKKGPE
jgi:PAS domain S-box-containing protein